MMIMTRRRRLVGEKKVGFQKRTMRDYKVDLV